MQALSAINSAVTKATLHGGKRKTKALSTWPALPLRCLVYGVELGLPLRLHDVRFALRVSFLLQRIKG